MTEKKQVNEGLSRRKFLLGAGALATGALASGIVGCSTAGSTSGGSAATGTGAAGTAPLPWQYKKLDVEAVRKAGYENYFEGGCMYGAASALIIELRKNGASSWSAIPVDMFRYGAGGAYGWGTLCGAINGVLAVMGMAAQNHSDLGNELMGWYTEFPFPSDKHESYCKIPGQITTVAGSPLCHISVSKWANKADARINEDAKKDRCAKLTGDTAAKAAELINQALDNKFVPAFKVPAEYSHCMSCHQGKDSTLDNEQGKMNCVDCHEDHTKKK